MTTLKKNLKIETKASAVGRREGQLRTGTAGAQRGCCDESVDNSSLVFEAAIL